MTARPSAHPPLESRIHHALPLQIGLHCSPLPAPLLHFFVGYGGEVTPGAGEGPTAWTRPMGEGSGAPGGVVRRGRGDARVVGWWSVVLLGVELGRAGPAPAEMGPIAGTWPAPPIPSSSGVLEGAAQDRWRDRDRMGNIWGFLNYHPAEGALLVPSPELAGTCKSV